MAKASLSLILPSFPPLLSHSLNQSEQPQYFTKIISKSTFLSHQDSLEKVLLQSFYPELQDAKDLPLATLRSDGNAELCADPCYVQADQGRLRMFHRDLELTDTEAQQFINALQPLFAERNMKLSLHTNKQWLVECTRPLDLHCNALTELEGASVLESLPKGADASELVALWNEAQMLLFDSPMNQSRQAERKLPVNSIWFWGTALLPEAYQNWQQVIGHHPLLNVLAERTQIPISSEINVNAQLTGSTLFLAPQLDWQQDWRNQLAEFERVFFKPLWQAVHWGRIKQLNLIVPEWGSYTLTPLRSWKLGT